MRTEKLRTQFIKWLDRILRDERGRAFLREKIKQNGLPVIELTDIRKERSTRPSATMN